MVIQARIATISSFWLKPRGMGRLNRNASIQTARKQNKASANAGTKRGRHAASPRMRMDCSSIAVVVHRNAVDAAVPWMKPSRVCKETVLVSAIAVVTSAMAPMTNISKGPALRVSGDSAR